MKTRNLAITLLSTLVFFNSCSDDDDDPKLPLGDYENGYFISNEGPFQNGSGTITFVGDDGTVSHNIYKNVNDEDLGNIVNTINFAGDNAYIIVNNSSKIIVANRYTMVKVTVIEGENISQPRRIVINGETGYVSNWGDPGNPSDDFIAVIDLNSNMVTNTIPVGEGPEDMLIENSKLYVNLQGGWSHNNQISIINIFSNTVDFTLNIGDVPNSLIADGQGNIWILCEGIPSWTGNETAGSLIKLNNNNDITSFVFDALDHPINLTNESGVMYYNLNGKVYKMNTGSNDLPTVAIDGLDGFYYAMKIHNGELFATNAGDFSSEGTLKVFNVNSGTLLETITAGIVPGDIVFP